MHKFFDSIAFAVAIVFGFSLWFFIVSFLLSVVFDYNSLLPCIIVVFFIALFHHFLNEK